MNYAEFQDALNALYENDWFKFLALPTLGGIIQVVRYLTQRKIEGKPDAERIEQLHKIADLKAKLDKDGTSLADLHSFRAEALGRSASAAIVTAQQFTNLASQLVNDTENAAQETDWDTALTQMQMNDVAGRKACQADKDLAITLTEKLQRLNDEEKLLLQASQVSWMAFRDAEVERESKRWEGGSIRPMMALLAHEAITRARIAGLLAEVDVEGQLR